MGIVVHVFLSNERCCVGGVKASGALLNRRLWRVREEGLACACVPV